MDVQQAATLSRLLHKGSDGQSGGLSGSQRQEKRRRRPVADVPVEFLDYAYVRECTSVDDLLNIRDVLKSGREGVYPDLEAVTEQRIRALDPSIELENDEAESKRMGEEDAECLAALDDWSTERSHAEKARALLEEQRARMEDGSGGPGRTRQLVAHASSTHKQDAPQLVSLPAAEAKRIGAVKAKVTSSELLVLADTEKAKGNEEFASKGFEAAVYHFSRSLEYMQRAHVYTNRALALIRLAKFAEAHADCTAALRLDPSNFKAYLRRGVSLLRRKMGEQALADFDAALRIEPNNEELRKLRTEASALF